MDCYIYQADLWCPDCAHQIMDTLRSEGKAPADDSDECTYDSDDFPKGPYRSDESDTPSFCAAGDGCLNATVLPDGSKVGMHFENDLTDAGVEYLADYVRTQPDNLAVRFQRDYYANAGYTLPPYEPQGDE